MNRGRALILAAFCVSMAASVGLTVLYALGGQPQLEGALLGIALGGIAVGLVLFGHRMLPGDNFVEPREMVPRATAQRPGVEAAFEAGAEPIERRRLIVTAFACDRWPCSAPPPSSRSGRSARGRDASSYHTSWRRGRRAVTEAGRRVRVDELDINSVVTVFPEGHEDAADSQTLLIRLPGGVKAPGPAEWSVDGVVAFSKVCTHAGCPVGLYQAETHELFCPCHQSTFVGARGRQADLWPRHPAPAAAADRPRRRGLRHRPVRLPEPVGPGFWNRP